MAVTGRQLDAAGLRDVHEASSLVPYLRATWDRRRYIWYVASSDLKGRQMNSVLGNLWYLLNPILQIGVYFLVFGVLLDTKRGIENFLTFLTIGTLVFTFIQRSAVTGSKAITSNLGLVRAVAFPRVVLPMTTTLTEFLAMAPSIVVIVTAALVTGEVPHPRWLLLVPVLLLATVFNAGVGMITARAASHLRDVQQILPFMFRLLFYSSGVLFSADAYVSGRYAWLFILNPVYCILTMARWTIFGDDLDPTLLVSASVWTVVVVVAGFVFFRRAEATYGRE